MHGGLPSPATVGQSHMNNCPLIRPRSARPPSPRWGEEGAAARPATSSPLGERVARAKPEPGEGDTDPGKTHMRLPCLKRGDQLVTRLSPISNAARARGALKLPISPLEGEMAGRPEGGA
jgi:assimilatory nitrate reductase catalytic subunit